MNRIVREHYPVANLPEDLRAGLANDLPVSVVIVQDELDGSVEGEEEPILGGDFTRLKHLRRPSFASSSDVDAYLDGLLDEWAHRER